MNKLSKYRWQFLFSLTLLTTLFGVVGLLFTGGGTATAVENASPTAVSNTSAALVGNLQSELGCPGDWQPDCAETELVNAGNGVWRGEFTIPTGSWEYKIAFNDTWDYAIPNDNVILDVVTDTIVIFYGDDKSNAVLDTVNHPQIPVAAGSFQSELGCAGDWQPECVLSLLTDADNNGIYTFENDTLPAGNYEFKIAFNEMWGGDIPGNNVPFTIEAVGDQLTISWDSSDDTVTADVVYITEDPVLAAPISHTIQDEIFYFVLPDRFEDGDPSNNEGPAPGGTPHRNRVSAQ